MSKSPTLFDSDVPGTLDLLSAVQFSPQGIVSRTLVAREGLRVTLFGFAAGQELTEHTSSSRALIQILSGSSAWIINGEAREVRAGEMLHLPPHAPHAVRAEEPFAMLLTLVREPESVPPDTHSAKSCANAPGATVAGPASPGPATS